VTSSPASVPPAPSRSRRRAPRGRRGESGWSRGSESPAWIPLDESSRKTKTSRPGPGGGGRSAPVVERGTIGGAIPQVEHGPAGHRVVAVAARDAEHGNPGRVGSQTWGPGRRRQVPVGERRPRLLRRRDVAGPQDRVGSPPPRPAPRARPRGGRPGRTTARAAAAPLDPQVGVADVQEPRLRPRWPWVRQGCLARSRPSRRGPFPRRSPKSQPVNGTSCGIPDATGFSLRSSSPRPAAILSGRRTSASPARSSADRPTTPRPGNAGFRLDYGARWLNARRTVRARVSMSNGFWMNSAPIWAGGDAGRPPRRTRHHDDPQSRPACAQAIARSGRQSREDEVGDQHVERRAHGDALASSPLAAAVTAYRASPGSRAAPPGSILVLDEQHAFPEPNAVDEPSRASRPGPAGRVAAGT
jgi:hypothetical protein